MTEWLFEYAKREFGLLHSQRASNARFSECAALFVPLILKCFLNDGILAATATQTHTHKLSGISSGEGCKLSIKTYQKLFVEITQTNTHRWTVKWKMLKKRECFHSREMKTVERLCNVWKLISKVRETMRFWKSNMDERRLSVYGRNIEWISILLENGSFCLHFKMGFWDGVKTLYWKSM